MGRARLHGNLLAGLPVGETGQGRGAGDQDGVLGEYGGLDGP